MSTVNAEEPEYESDPEELKHSLARRRREASDDDDDEQGTNQRPVIDSESEEDSFEDDEEEEEEEGIEKEKVSNVVKEEEEKEKKQSTVPTGGAFYMHDDRFQESSGGRSRGRRGGRVWGSGDERRWGHDKFEEVNTNTNDQRGSRGRFRGRGNGRGRGQERDYARGGSSSRGQQVYLPKDVTRGRGGQRKDDVVSVGNVNQAQRKQSRNPQEKASQRLGTASTKTGNDGYVKKNVVASSLSSASRPFYPSEPASNLVHGLQAGVERLHTNERHAPSGQKYSRNTKAPVSTAPAAGNALYPQSHNHGDRFSSSPMQFNGGSKGTGQSRYRPSGQGSAVGRSLSSSPRKTSTSRNRYFPDEIESVGETGASVGKGKGALQPSGSGSYMYGGSQVIGRADSLASGDNSNYPAYLPVMQFGAQHGGVPTIGMAFPGYYQSENGVGSPEMAWMPVLTGPGALGASYSPPYAAIDGSYQAHKPGLSSSAGSSSRENSTNNLNDLEKSMGRPDATESGVSQRQNNNPSKHPRRYSEMSFSK